MRPLVRTLALVAPLLALSLPASAAESLVYFGTYTGPKSQGIYVSRFDPATGRLGHPELAAATPNPSFLTADSTGRFLYAVNEVGEFRGEKTGSASAFAIDAASGKLTLLNDAATKGSGPCHLSLDRTGRHLLVANYDSGSIAVLPVQGDGKLGSASSVVQHTGHGPNKERQGGPHAHAIAVDAANRYALVADLGLDKLLVYRFDPAAGSLSPVAISFAASKPGAGPRHFDFDPTGRLVFALNEMALTLASYRFDAATGTLAEVQTISTLPAGVAVKPEMSGAEVRVHPSGRFIYASNRGHDSIAVFAVDRDKGTVRSVEVVATGAKTPRNFTLDPAGRHLLVANQGSDSVVVFIVDPVTGRLTRTANSVEVGAPVCVTFVPDRPTR
jgi:6-phosphogluconolactonase